MSRIQIVLKNLIREAGNRLSRECDASMAKKLTKKLESLAASIDRRHNLESLVLFVNESIAEYTRLRVQVAPRVVIGRTFATRDLIRARNKDKIYYVLILSRDRARLIEAHNDRVIREDPGNFPLENSFMNALSTAESAIAERVTNMQQEFFNTVDKQVNQVIGTNSRRVLICTEKSNYQIYLKVADRKEIILGTGTALESLKKRTTLSLPPGGFQNSEGRNKSPHSRTGTSSRRQSGAYRL